MRYVVCFFLTSVCIFSLQALEIQEMLVKARTLQSQKKDDDAILLLEAFNTTQNNPTVKVFLGRLYLAKAANIYNPWKKIKYAKIGMKLQDEALAMAPRNVFIRLERYKDNMYLPIFLKRSNDAVNDIPIIIQLIESVPRDELMREFYIWDSFNQYKPKDPDDIRVRIFLSQMVYYFAGDMYFRRSDMTTAKYYMEKCSSLGIDTAFGIRAYIWLNVEVQ